MLRLRTAATHPLSCSTGAKTSGARGLGPTFVHIRRAVLCNAIRVRFPLYGCSCCHAWLGGTGFCGWFDPAEKSGPLYIADRQKMSDEASKPTNGLSLRCDPHANLRQALRVRPLPGRVFLHISRLTSAPPLRHPIHGHRHSQVLMAWHWVLTQSHPCHHPPTVVPSQVIAIVARASQSCLPVGSGCV